LIWAIRRRKSLPHIEALVKAGADPLAKTKDGVSAYVFALQSGIPDVEEFLRASGGRETLSIEDQFVAACAFANEYDARRILAANSIMFNRLPEAQLRQLLNLTEARNLPAIRLMVKLGWPIAVTGGDWKASALNLAVYQGDPALTRFLLEHGASWTERHGFGGNVRGILGWASLNRPDWPGDWVGCARCLVEHGMPIPESSEEYSEALAAFFAEQKSKLFRE
jgi:hypothetical protein